MRLPIRIQRRRTRGWKMPAHTKYVGRGSTYGNPFWVARSQFELKYGGSFVVESPAEAVESLNAPFGARCFLPKRRASSRTQ